jgi:hypothetical protein
MEEVGEIGLRIECKGLRKVFWNGDFLNIQHDKILLLGCFLLKENFS